MVCEDRNVRIEILRRSDPLFLRKSMDVLFDWYVSSIRQSTKTNALEAGYRSVTDNHPCHELAGMIPFHVVYLFESDWFWIH